MSHFGFEFFFFVLFMNTKITYLVASNMQNSILEIFFLLLSYQFVYNQHVLTNYQAYLTAYVSHVQYVYMLICSCLCVCVGGAG